LTVRGETTYVGTYGRSSGAAHLPLGEGAVRPTNRSLREYVPRPCGVRMAAKASFDRGPKKTHKSETVAVTYDVCCHHRATPLRGCPGVLPNIKNSQRLTSSDFDCLAGPDVGAPFAGDLLDLGTDRCQLGSSQRVAAWWLGCSSCFGGPRLARCFTPPWAPPGDRCGRRGATAAGPRRSTATARCVAGTG